MPAVAADTVAGSSDSGSSGPGMMAEECTPDKKIGAADGRLDFGDGTPDFGTEIGSVTEIAEVLG